MGKCYSDQACFFLNSFDVSEDHFDEERAELIWGCCKLMAELDERNGDKGCYLEEFHAHRFLEKIKETKTILELRNKLRNQFKINRKQDMTLTEYLIVKYLENEGSVNEYLDTIQGDEKEVAKAKQLLKEASASATKAENARKIAAIAKDEAE